jgi:Tol biopolymer transport system component
VTDTLASVIKEEPKWSALPAATPTRVRVLLQRCLQKDPKHRLQAIGEARILLEDTLAGVPDSPVAPSSSLRAKNWLLWLTSGLAVAFFLAFSALVLLRVREKQRAPVETMRFEIPLPEKLTVADADPFALSPDGRQLAFGAAGSDGIFRLWLRSLDSLEVRPLSGSELLRSIAYPVFFWSPDGRYIAFNAGGKLRRRDVSSGEVDDLCDLSGTALDGSWRDGAIIFAEHTAGIMQVSATGGFASPLTNIDSSRKETAHDFPSFLPDGRHFIYLRLSGVPENSGAYVGSLDAKPEDQNRKRLLAADDFPVTYVRPSDSSSGQLLFVQNGKLLSQPFNIGRLELMGEPVTVADGLGTAVGFGVFSVSENGVLVYRALSSDDSQLTWFDRHGKVLSAAGERGNYQDIALSPDGKRAVYTRASDAQPGKRSLWMIDFSRGTTTRFTFGSDRVESPIWSPDGGRIIFSYAGGGYDLYQKLASGENDEELLLKSSEPKFPSSVSPDGRFLLYFTLDPKTKYDLWVLPLEGNKKPFPLLRTPFNEEDGHFSPDGHWIVYASDESGQYEVYVRRFSTQPTGEGPDTSGKWQVSYGGGQGPRWSADGKELYYVTPDWKLMAVDVTTDGAFRAGASRTLFQAPLRSGFSSFTVGDYTEDGKRFLFLASGEQRKHARFTVVLNWQAGSGK